MRSVLSGTEFRAGRHRASLLTLALAASLVFASAGTGRPASAPADPAPIEPAALEAATDMAADYLVSRARDDGAFLYRINLDPDVKVRARYNWRHHAGAVNALAAYHRATDRSEIVPVIERAVRHMRRRSMAPVRFVPGAVAIWTTAQATGIRGPVTAKLGAAGLGLASLIALGRIDPGAARKGQLTGLARFILAMQKPNGDFYFRFTPSRGGRLDNRRSPDFAGEAVLGLLRLYETDENPAWLKGARKALLYLSDIRRRRETVPADHRALVATGAIWPHVDGAERQTVRQHARQLVDRILSEQVWDDGSPAHGGFDADGQTMPTAARLEGLMAVEPLFRDDPDMHAKLLVSVSWGIRFLQNAQLSNGPHRGGFTRAIARLAASHPDARIFNPRATAIRIDTQHHALSALLQYQDLLREAADP